MILKAFLMFKEIKTIEIKQVAEDFVSTENQLGDYKYTVETVYKRFWAAKIEHLPSGNSVQLLPHMRDHELTDGLVFKNNGDEVSLVCTSKISK